MSLDKQEENKSDEGFGDLAEGLREESKLLSDVNAALISVAESKAILARLIEQVMSGELDGVVLGKTKAAHLKSLAEGSEHLDKFLEVLSGVLPAGQGVLAAEASQDSLPSAKSVQVEWSGAKTGKDRTNRKVEVDVQAFIKEHKLTGTEMVLLGAYHLNKQPETEDGFATRQLNQLLDELLPEKIGEKMHVVSNATKTLGTLEKNGLFSEVGEAALHQHKTLKMTPEGIETAERILRSKQISAPTK